MKSISQLLVLVAVLSVCGCKQITPQGASALTTAAVYAFGRNNPKIVQTMRQIQPAACEMAKNPASTLEDVVGIVENVGGVSEDTKAVLNVLLAIYQTSIYPNEITNTAKTHPYLEAVICPGWAGGLALLPGDGPNLGEAAKSESKVPRKWILVK